MKETVRIQIRTSEDIKRRASQLFEDLGLDLGTAINMRVDLVNDGPVTILLDTDKLMKPAASTAVI